ncbi:MAG TPA: 6-hydroxymethylpterin diphosphokinase MptE-like protein, partial [Tepidisphaeraceae bacterium]|nr:6-hydroxymethylpterin diphosphokinase MptE-like protein [Tepidisphaeraceae bacterium]
RSIAHINAGTNYIFAIHGFGLGYHVEALFDAASSESIFCIFEPDIKLFRTAMYCRDLSKLIESGRVMFFSSADKGDIFHRLQPHLPMVVSGMETVLHRPSVQLQGEFHEQIQTWLGEFRDYAKTSIQTLVLNGRRTAENISRNLAWYVKTPSIDRLKDRYKGQPAIIVSAGPSLRKNKHLLPAARESAVLIAVQTTLKPLLEMGVEPDFVTSLDYHDICTRFYENLPWKLSTELVAEPKASDRIFQLFPGPISLLGNTYAEGLLREMRIEKAPLPAGATVAHLAYYLAEYLGCDPIIFIGQDLGFSDGLCYAPGTSYEDVWRPELSRFCTLEMKQWEQVARDRNILRRIPDVHGNPIYTEERLFTYLQQFERDFSSTKTRIIDATEGGARKRNTQVMTLNEAMEHFCRKPISRADETKDARHKSVEGRLAETRQCILARRKEAERIADISRRTLPLLEQVREHLSDQDRVNQLIARIDGLRNEMNGLGQTYDLVTQLTQSTELRRFKADRQIAAEKLSGIERQRRQVTRDIENVESVIEAVGPFVQLMDEVAERLQSTRDSANLVTEMAA